MDSRGEHLMGYGWGGVAWSCQPLLTPQSCLQAAKSYRYGDMHEEAFEEQEMLGQIHSLRVSR